MERKYLLLLGFLFLITAPWAFAGEQTQIEKIIDKAIQATGGERIKAISGRSIYRLPFEEFVYVISVQFAFQPPEQFRLDMTGSFIFWGDMFSGSDPWFWWENIQKSLRFNQWRCQKGMDGERSWFREWGGPRPGRNEPGEAKEEEKEENLETQAWLFNLRLAYLPSTLQKKGLRLSFLGEIPIGNKAAVGIKVVHPQFREVKLYYDKESGLLLRRNTREIGFNLFAPPPMEDFSTFYLDHREVHGVKIPFKYRSVQKGFPPCENEITEIKLWEEKMDRRVFAKP